MSSAAAVIPTQPLQKYCPCQPVLLLLGQQRGHPVDQQLLNRRLSQALIAPRQPTLEGFRAISSQHIDPLTHPTKGDAGDLSHGTEVTKRVFLS